MNDPRPRPAADRPAVEIELSDNEPQRSRAAPEVTWSAGTSSAAAMPRRGRQLFVVFGVLVVAGGSVAAMTTGDDAQDQIDVAATTLDVSRITTPPTLPSLQTLPAAATPGTIGAGGDEEDGPDVTLPSRARFDPTTVTVPEFEEVVGVTPDELSVYDLIGAVKANAAGGTPMRTIVSVAGTHIDGQFNTSADVVIANDPETGRDSLAIERNLGERSEIVNDRTTGTVYSNVAGTDGRWERFTSEEFTRGTGTDQIGELFDALVTGPITSEALASAEIEPRGRVVRLDDGAVARPYSVTIPLDALRPYGVLLVTNISEQTVASGDAPDEITFEVYVTDQPRLALVTARFEADGVVFLLEQLFDRRPADVVIALPAPESILGPVFGAPGTASTSTP